MKQTQKSRRKFLKNAAMLSAVSAMPSVLTKTFGATNSIKAGDKVNLACIGIGNQGGSDVFSFDKTGLANFVAFCDVDMGAPQTQAVLKKFPDVPRFQDFRTMLEKMGDKIEAVSVGVPDFAHFPITMLALSMGKHVYTEKPMARTFQEVELMMKMAKKHPKLATQMGNQGHSEANYFQFKAWVDAGIIKDVTAITAHMNSARRWHGWDKKYTGLPAGEPVPGTLDWDIWQGVTKDHDYNHDYVQGQWRCWYDFGMGALGDWGAHLIDTAHQFLDLGLPYEVEMLKADGHNSFFYPQSSTIKFSFPARMNGMPPCVITWYDGVGNLPPLPAGYQGPGLDANIPPPSNGAITPQRLNPGKIIYGKDLTFAGGSHGKTLSIIPEEKAKEMASKLPFVPETPSNHYANFLKACMGQEKTRSPFEIAGPLSQVFCLGVIAQKFNTKIQFDKGSKTITNNKMANEMLVGLPPRKGWEQYYKLA